MKNSIKWWYVIGGSVQVILSIYLLMNPGVNLLSISWMLSFGVLFSGVSEIVYYFSKDKSERDGWLLFSGILGLLVGISLLSGSFITLPLTLPVIIGIWLIVFGIVRLVRAFKVRALSRQVSNLLIWTGILSIAFGIIVVNNPLVASLTIAYIVGFAFLYQGIVLFMDGFRG